MKALGFSVVLLLSGVLSCTLQVKGRTIRGHGLTMAMLMIGAGEVSSTHYTDG